MVGLHEQQRAEIAKMFEWKYPRGLGDNPLRTCVDQLNTAVPLAGMHICEPGCHTGNVTVDLAKLGAVVDASDPRPKNLVQAFARAVYEDVTDFCEFRLGTADQVEAPVESYDLLWHSGLFYHLENPVQHFHALTGKYPRVFLEGHVIARDRPVCSNFGPPTDLDGYAGHWWRGEGDWNCGLSGLQRKSFWLYRDEMLRLCHDCGWQVRELSWEPLFSISPRMGLLLTAG